MNKPVFLIVCVLSISLFLSLGTSEQGTICEASLGPFLGFDALCAVNPGKLLSGKAPDETFPLPTATIRKGQIVTLEHFLLFLYSDS
jgi:hypothetical protein